jgi:hypothetical protein
LRILCFFFKKLAIKTLNDTLNDQSLKKFAVIKWYAQLIFRVKEGKMHFWYDTCHAKYFSTLIPLKIDTKGPNRRERVKCLKSPQMGNIDKNDLNMFLETRFYKYQ